MFEDLSLREACARFVAALWAELLGEILVEGPGDDIPALADVLFYVRWLSRCLRNARCDAGEREEVAVAEGEDDLFSRDRFVRALTSPCTIPRAGYAPDIT